MKTKITALLCITFNALTAQILIDGSIDSAFGTNGFAKLNDVNYNIEPAVMHIGTDNKYYTASSIGTGNSRDVLLARLNANGTPDNTFGANGRAMFDPFLGGQDQVNDMKLGANNTIIIAGYSYAGNSQYFLARFLSNGDLDTTFNHSGTISGGNAYQDAWLGCALEPNGDITVVGKMSGADGNDKVIARYLSNGNLDSAFGYNGMNQLDEAAAEGITQIYRQSSTRYYVVGETNGVEKLYAYNNTGNLIGNFGSSGKFSFTHLAGYRIYVHDIAMQGDDLYMAGYARHMQTNKTDLMVCKMDKNGVLDNNFGSNGYYRADLAAGRNDIATEIKILADGSVFLVGETEGTDGFYTSASYLLASDGSLWSSYGNNGVMHYPVTGSESMFTMHMAENAQGKLTLLCWNTPLAGNTEAVLIRLKTSTSGIGYEENLPLKEVAVYPNPTANSLYVQFNSPIQTSLTLQVLDMSGRSIAQKNAEVTAGENTVDVSDLIKNTHPGIYILRLESAGANLGIIRVVKQ